MCDTMGLILEGKALFAKNSDRSPNEPQVTEFHPARDWDVKTIQTTYVSVEQAAHTYACLLSRPSWMWGAEMGVNEFGVCIGNEAVFTKGKYSKSGLTGMDMLRLALERSRNAEAARDVIIGLLERYGQGGNCGYDHAFYYDNGFLIMDRSSLFVLETAGKKWAYKAYQRASISNRLSLGADADAYSEGKPYHFTKKHTEPLFTFFSGSKDRWGQTCALIDQADSVPSLFAALRQHEPGVVHPLCQGSVRSTCMHAGGLVGDHSTASMVVELDEGIKVWMTGSSTPCISLFKPLRFGDYVEPLVHPGEARSDAYWQEREHFHRGVIGKVLPAEFYAARDQLEASWLVEADKSQQWRDLTQKALAQEAAFYNRWQSNPGCTDCGSKAFKRYWEKKTQNLGKERKL